MLDCRVSGTCGLFGGRFDFGLFGLVVFVYVLMFLLFG